MERKVDQFYTVWRKILIIIYLKNNICTFTSMYILSLSLSEYELNLSCHGHFLDVNYFPFLLIIIYLHIIKAKTTVHMHVVHNGYIHSMLYYLYIACSDWTVKQNLQCVTAY